CCPFSRCWPSSSRFGCKKSTKKRPDHVRKTLAPAKDHLLRHTRAHRHRGFVPCLLHAHHFAEAAKGYLPYPVLVTHQRHVAKLRRFARQEQLSDQHPQQFYRGRCVNLRVGTI